MKKKMILPAVLAAGLLAGIPAQAKWAPLEIVDSVKKIAKTKLGLHYTAKAIDEFVDALKVILEEVGKPQDQMNYKRLAAALIKTNRLIMVLGDIKKEILEPLSKGLGSATSIVKKGTKEKHQKFWKKFLTGGLDIIMKTDAMINKLVGLLDKEQMEKLEAAIKTEEVNQKWSAEDKEAAKKKARELFEKRMKPSFGIPSKEKLEEMKKKRQEMIEIKKI